MSKPYGLISDLHCSDWSSFGGQDKRGRNVRLMQTLAEVDRCCQEVKDAGGDTVFLAGDLFHVRGSIKPSVFNPVRACLQSWGGDIEFIGIPGNHDLEGKTAGALGSTVAMLESSHTSFAHEPLLMWGKKILLVPYVGGGRATMQVLKAEVERIGRSNNLALVDAIIHCGIDGTLKGVPDHGFGPQDLAKLGFKRVFAGDYHAHKDFGNGIYSIGALTHQTWGDVGTKAGFLIVHEDRVDFRATHAPKFVDLTGDEDPVDVPLIVDGHYVRTKIRHASGADVEAWRTQLMGMGARGVVILQQPDTVTTRRAGASVKSLARLDESVADYVREQGYDAGVAALCAGILKEIAS